jgi:serine protease
MKKWLVFLIVLVFLSMLVFPGASGKRFLKFKKDKAGQRYNSEEIVVKISPDVNEEKLQQVLKKYNLKLRKKGKKHKFMVLKTTKSEDVLEKIKQLQNESELFTDVSKHYIDTLASTEGTAGTSSLLQWYMKKIDCDNAWPKSTGANVVVAVLDTGVRKTHPGLKNAKFTTGYDFVNDDNDPSDDNNHGTHISGIIGMPYNGVNGLSGVAYNCTIMPIKVLDAAGNGNHVDVADGIYWAVDHGAHIINLSLGGPHSQSKEDAVKYANDRGVLVVCAAGNTADGTQFYPAAYPSTLSISAIDYNNQLAPYSNYGATISLCAPGGSNRDFNYDAYWDAIISCSFDSVSNDNILSYRYGTSSAASQVTGVAALIKAANPTLTPRDIKKILESTSQDLGDPGWDPYYGYGLINAANALNRAAAFNQGNVDFTYSINTKTVYFKDASVLQSGVNYTWKWNFGDGTISTLKDPTYTYGYPGAYYVTLQVTSASGITEFAGRQVSVTDGTVKEYLYADFSSSTNNFTYADDVFEDTYQPNFATGYLTKLSYGSGGYIWVKLGNNSYGGKSSGGFSRTFSLATPDVVTVGYHYYLIHGYDYDKTDYTAAICMIDGTKYGSASNNYVCQLQGDGYPDENYIGWKYHQFSVYLNAGNHTITLGALGNDASYGYAYAKAYFDNVRITSGGVTASSSSSTSSNYYCSVNGWSSTWAWVSRFDAGGFSNTSSWGNYGYSNFTGKIIELAAGKNHTVLIKPGFYGSALYVYCRIWIDFNGDGDFDDPKELAFSQYDYKTVSGSIFIPVTASVSQTRMRVSVIYGYDTDGPCTPFYDGEMEDYTLRIVNGDQKGGGEQHYLRLDSR